MRISDWSSDVCSSDLDLVDQRGLEIVRHEAGADALDLVRAGLAAGEHGAVLGLDGNHPQPRLARLQRLADAGQRAAGADGGDDDVDTAGSDAPDLLSCGAEVDFRVGRVVALMRHHRAVLDRKSVVSGKSVLVSVDSRGCRIIQKKITNKQ